MNIFHLAIVAYGALTLVLTFVLALTVDRPVAALLIVLAAGLTYVFQVAEEYHQTGHAGWGALRAPLWIAVLVLVGIAWASIAGAF